MKRTPLKRGKRLKPRNAKRRASEFERCYRSKHYLRHLHAMPCYACGKHGETDAAHGQTGGMGFKAGWETLLPLCRTHHQEMHQHGAKTFATKYNVNYKEAAVKTLESYVALGGI